MVAAPPECPACGAPLRLTSDLTDTGLSRSWVCTDSTCPTVLSADQARALAVRDDVLGAPIEALMQAPVTPQGGGGGNGRSRRQPKPGDREAMQARRERRYLDQASAGGRDRDGHVERVTQVIKARVDEDTAAEIADVMELFALTESAFVRQAVVAYRVRLQHSGRCCGSCSFWVKDGEDSCPQCGG